MISLHINSSFSSSLFVVYNSGNFSKRSSKNMTYPRLFLSLNFSLDGDRIRHIPKFFVVDSIWLENSQKYEQILMNADRYFYNYQLWRYVVRGLCFVRITKSNSGLTNTVQYICISDGN